MPDMKDRDVEVHAIAAILHDLGWATSGDLVSKDKRFEVDSAEGTRKLLLRETKKENWDVQRLQLAWADFQGPKGGLLTQEVWDNVLAEFPRLGFRDGIKRILCGICRTKPETTCDNFVSSFGVAYV